MLTWPFTADATLTVQGISFWIAVIGLPVAIGGIVFTLIQLAETKRAAQAVSDEISKIQVSLTKYDASVETSKAEMALNQVKRYILAGEWVGGQRSYEEFLACLFAIQTLALPDLTGLSPDISEAMKYGETLCNRLAASGEVEIDIVKTGAALRKHAQLITSIRIALQRSMVA